MSNSLEDLDPHKYFGTVVPPNNETTPMGVTGTFKVGLGVHHVLTSDEHFSKKSVSAPHRTSQFFEKNSPHRTSPHIIIFLPHPHRTHTPPHIRLP